MQELIDLKEVDDIGEVIAESLVAYFKDKDNLRIIERLREKGIQLSLKEEAYKPKSNILEGKSFVVSGVFTQFSRDDIKKMIEENGGKNTGSISSKTDYLLAGSDMGPTKLKKAKLLSIKIISEEDFMTMINQ